MMFFTAALNSSGQVCEFVNNGNFEAGATCGIMPPTGGGITGLINNWQTLSGTPDIVAAGGCIGSVFEINKETNSIATWGSNVGTSVGVPASGSGTHIVGITSSNGFYETFMQQLQASFQVGRTYKISFKAKLGDLSTYYSGGNISGNIGFYSSNTANIPAAANPAISLAQITTLTPLASVGINTSPYNPANPWQTYTASFTFNGTTGQDRLYIGGNVLAGQNGNYIYLDDISIQESTVNITGGDRTICSIFSTPTTLVASPVGGTWSSSSNTVATINATSGAVTPLKIGTTLITYSVVNATTGCINTASILVNVNACCLSSTDTKIAGTAATPAIVSSISYPTKSYYIANDITIQGTVNFTDANVLVAPGVKITVDDNAVFNIAGSHFYSCTDMWQGIYTTSSTAKINITSSATRSSLIEDAKEAVSCYFPTGGSSITGKLLSVSNTIFNRNNVSIKINNFQQGVSGTINLPFSYQNTAFTSRNIGFTKATLTWPTVANFITPNSSVPYTLNQIPNTLYSPYIDNVKYQDNVAGAYLKLTGTPKKPDFGIVLKNIGNVAAATKIVLGRDNIDDIDVEDSNPSDALVIVPATTNKACVFDNLAIGIDAEASNFMVTNSIFQKPALGTSCFGVKVYNAVENYITIDGLGVSNIKNAFFDMNTAINSIGCINLTTSNNVFRSSKSTATPTSPTGKFAIMGVSGGFKNLNILNNEITNINTGIYVYNMFGNTVGANGVLNINNNTIQATNPLITAAGTELLYNAIKIITFAPAVDDGLGNQQPININGNLIYNAFNGIFVSRLRGKDFRINNNTITLNATNPTGDAFQYAIYAQGGDPLDMNAIENNTITGTNNLAFNQSGIFLQSQYSTRVGCNNVTNLQNGFRFNGDNSSTTFWDNFMNPSNLYGFTLENNGIIGQQGNARSRNRNNGCTSNNSWGGDNNAWLSQNHFKSYVNNSWAYLSKFYTYSTAATSWRNRNGAGGGLFPSFAFQTTNIPTNINGTLTNTQSIVLGNNDPNCPHCTWATLPAGGLGRDAAEVDENQEAIAEGTLDIIGDEAEQRLYVMQEQLFEQLKDNTELTTQSPILNNFVNDNSWGSFDFIYYTAKYLSKKENSSVDVLLNYFPSNNIVDDNYWQYYKWVNEMQKNTEYTPSIEQVLAMANLCPAKHGNVVFDARNLYNMLTQDNKSFADDCETTIAARGVKTKKETRTVDNKKMVEGVIVYPNPAKDYIAINGKLIKEVSITSIDGRVMLKQQCSNVYSTTINIKNLIAGLYIIKTIDSKGVIITNKLIKQ